MSEENTMETTETGNIEQLEEFEDCKRAYRYLFNGISEMMDKLKMMQIIAESLYIGDAIRRKDIFPEVDIDEAE